MDYEVEEYTVVIVLGCVAFLAVIALCLYLFCYSRKVWQRYKSRIHDVGANFNCQIRQIEVERNEKEAAVKELQILKETNKMLQKEILMLNGKLKKETYAKEEALTRLSEKISLNLTENNPNIADLSDINRPTNLVDKFSTLYDDEWTRAFDELQTIPGYEDDQKAIKQLLDIIMECFQTCRELASEQLTNGLLLSNSNIKITDLPMEMGKIIKDKRKTMYDADLPIVLERLLKKFGQDQKELQTYDTIMKYIQRCTEISWLMAIQDPPMAVSREIRDDFRFDKTKYKEYTKLGQIVDFVVWPAVLIQDGGHLMAKGIVQCCDAWRGSK